MKKYYKVMKDNKVIDVLDEIVYLKWQKKHHIMLLTDINDAQAIFSSDRTQIWHEVSLYKLPIDGYETVELQEIDEFEFKQLKALNGKTPEEIIDNFVLLLLESEVL